MPHPRLVFVACVLCLSLGCTKRTALKRLDTVSVWVSKHAGVSRKGAASVEAIKPYVDSLEDGSTKKSLVRGLDNLAKTGLDLSATFDSVPIGQLCGACVDSFH